MIIKLKIFKKNKTFKKTGGSNYIDFFNVLMFIKYFNNICSCSEKAF